MPVNGDLRISINTQTMPECTVSANPGRERLLSIMEQANEIAGTPDVTSVIQGMLDLMIEVTLAESANFFLLDTATDELVITHVRGDGNSQYLVGLRLNRQLGLPGMSINGKKPVVIGDLPSDLNWLHTIDPAGAARKRNVINLPVATQDQIQGVIQIFNYQQAELDLLLVLSNRLAVELAHRLELDTTLHTNHRLMSLVDVLGEVAGTLNRNQLLHLVTENAARLVQAERSSIFLVDPETDEMIFQVAYRSPEGEQPPAACDTGLPAINPVATQRRSFPRPSSAYRSNDEFNYFNSSAITSPIRSGPLTNDHAVDRSHILGGLMVHNKQTGAFQEYDAQLLQILANQASTFLQVAEMYESAGELFLGVIKSLAAAIDAKDPHTQGHSQRVSDYSVLISRELGLDESLVNDLRIGSLLHDIGKIGITDSILLKNGALTAEEYRVIKRHPNTGVNILSQVKLLESILPAIAEHHERLDGSGYPAGLSNHQISWMGRIVAVADVFDALASDRPYRPALSIPEVLAYLKDNAGVLFDPQCVQALETIVTRSNGATGP